MDEARGVVEQRAGTPESARSLTDQLWVPEGLPEDVVPEPDDSYVVIDDLADGVAVLSAAPWPHLDRAGRLAFEPGALDAPVHLGKSQHSLQARVDELRAGHAEPSIASRSIRIGDVFLVRGFTSRISSWQLLVDVTPQARTAAKIALFGAIAPRVSQDRARQLGLRETSASQPRSPAKTTRAGGATPAV
jgi:hypothetical protein